MQLLAVDGKLHLLRKEQVAEMAREKSVMPKLAATAEERRNLIAYLSRLTAERREDARARRAGQRRFVCRRGSSEAGLLAHLRRPTERQPFQPARPDQHPERRPARAEMDVHASGRPSLARVTPVVVDGVMYVTAVNEAYALDARSGREIWHYSRPRTQGSRATRPAGSIAAWRCSATASSWSRTTLTCSRCTASPASLSGTSRWRTTRQNYGSTGAPLVVNDLVIAGVSGGDEGMRGFLDAYKASTGERAWRFWTIPARGEPGSETWVGRALEHGCGATWLTGTYDPEAAPALLADGQSLPRLQRR